MQVILITFIVYTVLTLSENFVFEDPSLNLYSDLQRRPSSHNNMMAVHLHTDRE